MRIVSFLILVVLAIVIWFLMTEVKNQIAPLYDWEVMMQEIERDGHMMGLMETLIEVLYRLGVRNVQRVENVVGGEVMTFEWEGAQFELRARGTAEDE